MLYNLTVDSWKLALERDSKLKELAIKAGVENNYERVKELNGCFAWNCGDDVVKTEEERELAKYMFLIEEESPSNLEKTSFEGTKMKILENKLSAKRTKIVKGKDGKKGLKINGKLVLSIEYDNINISGKYVSMEQYGVIKMARIEELLNDFVQNENQDKTHKNLKLCNCPIMEEAREVRKKAIWISVLLIIFLAIIAIIMILIG